MSLTGDARTSRLLVIVPSRGRPTNCERLAIAFDATSVGTADILFVIDPDDPLRDDYTRADSPIDGRWLILAERLRLGPTLNHVAECFANSYDHFGFLGDDHLLRTHGWDERVAAELDHLGTGLVYGNDLIQGEALPTAVFMTSDIVRTLGWMAPPGLIHLFLDNSWLALGQALDAITYLPDVVIEHRHPLVGKAATDAGYAECNAPDVWAHDEAIYRRWRDEQLAADVERIRATRLVRG